MQRSKNLSPYEKCMIQLESKDLEHFELTPEQQIVVLTLYNATDNPKAGLAIDIEHAQQNGYDLKQHLATLSSVISMQDTALDNTIGKLFLSKTPKEFVVEANLEMICTNSKH